MNKEQKNAQSIVEQIVEAHTFQEPRFMVTRSRWWTPHSRLNRAGKVAKRREKAKAALRRKVKRSLGAKA